MIWNIIIIFQNCEHLSSTHSTLTFSSAATTIIGSLQAMLTFPDDALGGGGAFAYNLEVMHRKKATMGIIPKIQSQTIQEKGRRYTSIKTSEGPVFCTKIPVKQNLN